MKMSTTELLAPMENGEVFNLIRDISNSCTAFENVLKVIPGVKKGEKVASKSDFFAIHGGIFAVRGDFFAINGEIFAIDGEIFAAQGEISAWKRF